jgi:GNAT superfamily N-acetyltransferase
MNLPSLRLTHPTTASLLASRDRLLTRALRSGGAPWPIAAEYPIVLGEAGTAWSWCLVGEETGGSGESEVVAHANLWPRELVSTEAVQVGLVGNVATRTELRGRGVMARLLGEIEAEAGRAEIEALVLWSDLSEFYQKLGFKSSGRERRYVYGGKVAAAAGKAGGAGWRSVDPKTVTAGDCELWLATRARTRSPTLSRTPEEMRQLLQIPGVTVYAHAGGGGFAVMGRGADMVGVVHEWGAPSPGELFGVLAAARARAKAAEVMLLAPPTLPEGWDEELAAPTERVENHPMAWTKVLATGARAADVERTLDAAFVWGLDSI